MIAQAERFGVPPWEIEDSVTSRWYHRIAAYDEAMKRKREDERRK